MVFALVRRVAEHKELLVENGADVREYFDNSQQLDNQIIVNAFNALANAVRGNQNGMHAPDAINNYVYLVRLLARLDNTIIAYGFITGVFP